MTHTVITFLGIRPQQTTYRYDGREYQGQVFAEAILQFLPFDRMLVLTTPAAESVYSSTLETRKDPRIQKIPIPTGRDDEEMWGIFDKVIESIEEGEEVTFDITHGLRSIPFLAFLFAAYLKSAKGVTIRSILYGALDLQKENDGVAPVLDLSRFASMLDWINASEFFVQTGNAQPLAQLLEMREDQKQKDAAKTLREVSLAASLCQPFTLGEKVAQLSTSLEKAADSFSYTSQPFSVLKGRIVRTFEQFKLPPELKKSTPLQEGNAKELLAQEWQLIEWYRNNGHMLQAISLTREYMVDMLSLRLRKCIDFGKPREEVERAINGIARTQREKKPLPREELNPIAQKWLESDEQEAKQTAKIFSNLADVRNQMDHAEHQSSAMSFEKLTEKAENYLNEIRRLSQRWQILPSDETPPSD